jgi:hypothetical protein
MAMTSMDTEAPAVQISGWKLYAVTFGSILLAAILAALIWVVGPSVAPIQMPSYIWSAIGFCVLGLLLIPAQKSSRPSRTARAALQRATPSSACSSAASSTPVPCICCCSASELRVEYGCALRFAVPEREAKDSFLRYGNITVDVGEAIIKKWRASGQRPSGFTITGTTINITDPNAVLSGLRFNAGEEQTLTVKMQLKPTVQFLTDRTFNWDLTELASLQPDAPPSTIGGERYSFTASGNRRAPTNNTN